MEVINFELGKSTKKQQSEKESEESTKILQ